MAHHWCKVASNLDGHPKIRRAGRLGREVFLFALRRNAEPGNKTPGCLPKEELDPDYVAYQLMMTRDEAVTGVTAAVTAGLLRDEGDFFVIVSWTDGWGKTSHSSADRQARYRKNKRIQNSDVTRDGGDGSDVTRDTDQIRLDKTIIGEQVAKPKQRAHRIPADWKPRPEEIQSCREKALNSETEAAHFRDHHTAKGTVYLNWDAAFRTWIHNAVRFGRGSQAPANGDRKPKRIPNL